MEPNRQTTARIQTMLRRTPMKSLPWVIAATALGIAAYVVINTPGPEYATGSDSVEDAARGTSQWGSKSRVKGTGTNLFGKAKEAVGNVTGNQDLANEGVGDQIVGKVKDAAGSVAQAAGQAIHDLNK
jgi:uncharacterized protein YjbJ (UPF0337 family)